MLKPLTRPVLRSSVRALSHGWEQVAVGLAVANQSITRGALTRQNHAAHTWQASTGTIQSVSKSGAGSEDWNISVTGGVVTATPAQDGLTGPYSFTVSCFSEAAQAGMPVDITFACATTANTYTVASDAEFNAAVTDMGALVGDRTIQFLTNGSYSSGLTLRPTSVNGTVTLTGESAISKADIGSLYMRDISTNGNVVVKWLKTNNPRQNIYNAGIIYDRPGNSLTIEECEGVGPFTPDTNTDRTYWAAVDYESGTGVPVVGRTLTDGSNQAEILDVDDNGDGTGTVWVSDLSSEGSENWTLGETLTESISGNTFDVAVTKYGGLPDAHKATAVQSGGGLSDWNQIIVRGCAYSNFTQGIFLRANDNLELNDNSVINHYEDAYKTDPEDLTSPPSVTSDGNLSLNCYSNARDFNNPHSDAHQYNASGLSANWSNITHQNNKYITGDTRGTGLQTVFGDDIPSPYWFEIKARNNLCVTRDSAHGISFSRVRNSEFHNNTVVTRDPVEAATDALTVSIRVSVDGGGNVAQNNVCDGFNIASFGVDNNVTLGKGGSTISYATAFNPDVFSAPASLAEAITQYEPEPNGPLLAGASYVIGDTGCIDNTPAFVDWNSSSVQITPRAFPDADWSVSDDGTGTSVTVNITNLPFSGADPVTDVECRIDGGSAVSSGGTVSFQITGLTPDQSYDFEIRAINAQGNGDWSSVKARTPTSAGYTQNFVDTNGTAAFVPTSLVGASDSQYLTYALTLNSSDLTGTQALYEISGRSLIQLIDGTLNVRIRSNANVTIYEATSTTTLANNTEYQIVIIADMGGTPSVDVYINGALETMTVTTAAATGTIDHTRSGYGFLSQRTGSFVLNAEVADLFVDFSQDHVIADFYDTAPKDLAGIGSPISRFGGDQTETDWNAGTNLGSGGNLTLTSATFTDV